MEPPAFAGIADHEPDLAEAKRQSEKIDRATGQLLALAPGAGSYLSESDFFEKDWKRSFWGPNYPRLAAAKRKYDPDGLFFVHQGVGSDEWSPDGFRRLG
jgi:hypothetical protein